MKLCQIKVSQVTETPPEKCKKKTQFMIPIKCRYPGAIHTDFRMLAFHLISVVNVVYLKHVNSVTNIILLPQI